MEKEAEWFKQKIRRPHDLHVYIINYCRRYVTMTFRIFTWNGKTNMEDKQDRGKNKEVSNINKSGS